MKNKRGWLEIVEAFTSVLLIAGVLILIAGNFRAGNQNFSSQVYDLEHAILREIQLSNLLRTEIISVSPGNLPIERDDAGFPQNTKAKIIDKTPSHLECAAKLCAIPDICVSNIPPVGKDIFVQSVFIGANVDNYSPKKLNLFCWNK